MLLLLLSLLFHSFGISNSRGVTIFINKFSDVIVKDAEIDSKGRFILMNIEIDDQVYSIVNVYAPNFTRNRDLFFKEIKSRLCKFKNGPLIIGGDFNEVLRPGDRKTTSTNNINNIKKTNLTNMKQYFKLIDIWREKNETISQFTWRRKNKNEASRIDYFLIEKDINYITMKLKKYKNKRGTGTWKMNNNLLNKIEYIKLINDTIDETLITCSNTDLDCCKWYYCKSVINYKTIQYAKNSTKINKLESKIILMEAENRDKQNIDNAKNRLESLYIEKTKGAQIRSRINWIENGEEKKHAYFLNLEKQRQTKKTIL